MTKRKRKAEADKRAAVAASFLLDYPETPDGHNEKETVKDALTDIMCYCQSRRLAFWDLLELARQSFRTEYSGPASHKDADFFVCRGEAVLEGLAEVVAARLGFSMSRVRKLLKGIDLDSYWETDIGPLVNKLTAYARARWQVQARKD